MFRLVTGIVGSGKTQVMSILRSKGYICINTDDISRHLRGTIEIKNKAKDIFGPECLAPDGTIDIKYLRYAFINEPEKFEKYDNFIMGRVSNKLRGIDEIEEPIFVECASVQKHIDALLETIQIEDVIIVETKSEIRAQRLKGRNMSDEQRVHTESLQDSTIRLSNRIPHIVPNNGSLQDLKMYVQDLLESIKFTDEEKEELFQRLYWESPDFVRPNVRCYFYYNMKGCTNCPFPCSQSDKNFNMARMRNNEKVLKCQ